MEQAKKAQQLGFSSVAEMERILPPEERNISWNLYWDYKRVKLQANQLRPKADEVYIYYSPCGCIPREIEDFGRYCNGFFLSPKPLLLRPVVKSPTRVE